MNSVTYITPRTLKAKTAQWLREIEPFNYRKRSFRPRSGALIVVDTQRFFIEKPYPLSCENSRVILPRLRKLIAAFRRAGRPVLYVAQMHKGVDVDRGEQLSRWWPTPPLEGRPEVLIHPQLAPRPGEKVIPKRRYSGFYATDLDVTLRVMKVTDVVVCGVLTNVCVDCTARDAFFRDYRVFLVADGTAAMDEGMHLAALRTAAGWYAKVVDTERICAACSALKR